MAIQYKLDLKFVCNISKVIDQMRYAYVQRTNDAIEI